MTESAESDRSSTIGSDDDPKFSVVVPVFNEEGCLDALNERLVAVMEGMGESFEVIYVNDGSSDRSQELLDGYASADRRVRVIHFMRNFGQHPAVYAGFANLRGETVFTLDADLQNPPEELPKLLAKLEEGYEVVAGVRAERRDSILRTFPSRIVNWMVGRLTRVPLRDYGCLLRAYRRPVIEMLLLCEERTKYFTALISWLGVKIAEVDVEHAPRAAGDSKYNFRKLITMNFDLLTGFSILPIQLISLLGFVAATGGMLLSGFFLVLGLVYDHDRTLWWTLLALSAGFFFFGLLVVAMGFLGEYIGRVLIEVKARPYYLIRRQSNEPEPASQATSSVPPQGTRSPHP